MLTIVDIPEAHHLRTQMRRMLPAVNVLVVDERHDSGIGIRMQPRDESVTTPPLREPVKATDAHEDGRPLLTTLEGGEQGPRHRLVHSHVVCELSDATGNVLGDVIAPGRSKHQRG